MIPPRRRIPFTPYLLLGVGVVSTSFAAIFIRLAEAPALVIAAYRLAIAVLLLAPPTLYLRHAEVGAVRRQDLALPLLAGVALAVHFALWIASLQLTSVASSVVLVTAHPLVVALVAPLFTSDPFSPRAVGAALLGTVGIAVLSAGDLVLSREMLLGDAMALLGGWMVAGYLIIGRRVGTRMPLSLYITFVYGVAALLLTGAVLLFRLPVTGFSSTTYLMFLLLALVPQMLGHSAINWAVRRLSTTFVAVSILGEPIGATLLAFLVLGEAPPPTSILGGAVILGSISVAFREEQRLAKVR